MPRGYRSFIFTVVGVLIAAGAIWTYLKPTYPSLPTDQYQKADEGKYSPGSPACYPSRLRTLPRRVSEDERYRCETAADEHRLKGDDLVQQTRAADAAYEIVGLTYNQSLMMLAGTIFGLLTLVAAFAAVLYAKRAADAAKDTLDHQKETSRRQLRPYVYIGEARLTLPFSSKSKVTLDIKNFGLSPAVNIKSGMRNSLVTRPIGEQARDLEMIEWEDMPVLGPQGDNQLHVGLTEFDADDIFDIECGAIALVAHHAITYEDLDGNKDGHDAWFYIDKNTLVDGVVMTLNEWARYNSHREPEGDNPELELKRGK